jgi:predicted enzyme related to lactoylglutathione lyase
MKSLAFSFTKLVVDNLDACERFYCAVFGMKVFGRNTATEHAYAQEETMLSLTGAPDSNVLILTRYLNRPCPPPGSVWIGFTVSDIEASLDAAENAGGTIVVPLHENTEHGVLAGIVLDPAGHLIELVQVINR